MIQNVAADFEGKPIEFFKKNIGRRVCKTTIRDFSEPKSFKSGNKVNTILDVIDHPKLHIPAYVFEEDNSYVECRRCVLFNESPSHYFTPKARIRIAKDSSGVDKYTEKEVLDALNDGSAIIETNTTGITTYFIRDLSKGKRIMGVIEYFI